MKKILIGIVCIVIIIIFVIVGLNYYQEQKEMELVRQAEIEKEKKFVEQIEKYVQIKVYVNNSATEEIINEIGKELEEIEHVKEVKFHSKEDALEEMQEFLDDNAYLLDVYEGENNIFPVSYTIKCEIDSLDNLDYYKDVENDINNIKNSKYIEEILNSYASIKYLYENDMDMLEMILDKTEESKNE